MLWALSVGHMLFKTKKDEIRVMSRQLLVFGKKIPCDK